MILDDRKIYYVYEWYNIDTGEIFYVGKGRGNRCRDRAPADRNKPFIKYINEHNCTYRKIFENLDEDTACQLEDKRIKELKGKGQCICNLTNRTSHRGCLYGKDNGFYGKKHTAESLRKMSEANLNGRNAGENNSQYGVSPKERMSKDVYEGWLYKQQHNKDGDMNGRATNIYAYNDCEKLEFTCITYCAEYLREKNNITANLDTVRSRISECIRCKTAYYGYKFEMNDDKFNYNPKVKINVSIKMPLFEYISKFSKDKNISSSKAIEVLLKKYVESSYDIVKTDKKTISQNKTLRLNKNLFDAVSKKDLGFGLSCIINNLIGMLVKGDISIENK